MKKGQRHPTWQQFELDRCLQEHGKEPMFDLKPVFLPNPHCVQQYDKLIEEGVWPAILQGLEGTGLRVATAPKGFPASQIRDGRGDFTSRSLTFVLEDPDRPLVPGGPWPWYSRGEVSCDPFHCSIRFDFHLYLPLQGGLERAIEILSDPAFCECPPHLTIWESSREMVIAFSGRAGTGWRTDDASESLAAGAKISGAVRQQFALVKAVDDFKGSPANETAFANLRTILRALYGHD